MSVRKNDAAKRLTPQEITPIAELGRLQTPLKQIAKKVGRSPKSAPTTPLPVWQLPLIQQPGALTSPSLYGIPRPMYPIPVTSGMQSQPYVGFPGQMHVPSLPSYGLPGLGAPIQQNVPPFFNPLLGVASPTSHNPLPTSSFPYRASDEENVSLSTQEQNSVTAINSISQYPYQSLDFNTSNPERRETPERNLTDPIEFALAENSVTEDEEVYGEGLTFALMKDLATKDTSSNKEENLDRTTSTTTTTITDKTHSNNADVTNSSPNPLSKIPLREKEEVSNESMGEAEKDEERKGSSGVSIEVTRKTFKDLTEEDKEKIRQDTRNGKSQRKLGEDFDVSHETIRRWQKKLELVIVKNNKSE